MLGGVRVSGEIDSIISYLLTAGANYDLKRKTSQLTGNSLSGGTPLFGLETFSSDIVTTINRLRPYAAAVMMYSFDRMQKLITTVSVRGQPYSNQPHVTMQAGFQIGF